MAQGEPVPTPPADRRWRGDGSPYSQSGASRRRSLVLKLTALALAIVAAVFGLLTYLKPTARPYVLSIPVREYKHSLYPVNAFAEQDCKDLTACFADKNMINAAFNSQIKERIEGELANLRDHADRPLVVHLSCLATVRHGEVFLLPADAQPDLPASWLPLTQVLDKLAAIPAPGKLLLLDIGHPVVDGRLGVLCDNLMEQVDQELSQRDLKGSYVLCSCSGGQGSLASEELRASVFGYYVAQGLRGAADGALDGTRNQRITVKELAGYVSERTDRWAQQNRGQRQTPRLWGDGLNFTLVDFQDEPAVPEPGRMDYPPWLRQGWNKRDEMLQAQVQRLAPHLLREWEEDLLRREQRWRGGFEPQTLASEMQTMLAKDPFKQLPKSPGPPLPPRSLPLKLAQAPPSTSLTPQNVRELAFILDQAAKPAEKKEELAKIQEQWLKLTSNKDVPPALWAYELLGAAANISQPKSTQLAFVQEALQQLGIGPKQIESVWLLRMADFDARIKNKDQNEWSWPASQVRQSLRAVRARETLIAQAVQEPGSLAAGDSWFDKRFRQAEKDRQQGDKLLLWGRPKDWPAALKLLQQAEGEYRKLLDDVLHWQNALNAWEDVLALAPAFVPYLASPSVPDLEANQWLQVVEQGQQLSDVFIISRPEQAELPVDGDVLTYRRKKLQEPLDVQATALTQLAAAGDVATLAKMEALLATARLDANQREALWNAARLLKLQLLNRTLQLDRQDLNSPARAATPPTPPRPQEQWPSLTAQANRQARLSLGLLQLGGVQRLEPAWKEWQQAQAASWPQEFNKLAELIAQAWMKQLPEQFKNAKRSAAHADRFSRILPSSDSTAAGQVALNSAAVQRQRRQLEFKRWLGERYKEEADFLHGPGIQERSGVIEFFQETAQEMKR